MDTKVFTKILICLVFLTSISCQKKELENLASEDNSRAEVPVDHSLHCENNFIPHWCGANRELSQITEVCVGELSLGEDTLFAISLTQAEISKCLVADGRKESTSFSGCAQAFKEGFVEDLQGQNPIESLICYSQGRPAYLEGTSSQGQAFRTFYIE